MKLSKKTTSINVRRHGRRGFTLVELITVLTILAILAAIGVGSVVGYIRKSRFDQNSQYAVTIYQTAQTALSQKTSNGTIDDWVGLNKELFWTYSGGQITKLDMVFTEGLLGNLDDANEAINQIVYLTYNPGNSSEESQALYSLLSEYFYDRSVFNGTISVEFDVNVSCNPLSADGLTYSARVVSAFYSIQNSSSEGWDDLCKQGAEPNDGLPNRNGDYRYTKSLVGYYNGTEASIKPQISSVFLPQSQIYDLQGHIISESEDPNAHGFLFNMRNGETLDVSWSIFAESDSELSNYAEDIMITLSDADTIAFNDEENDPTDDVILIVDSEALNSFRFDNLVSSHNTGDCRIVVENVDNTTITRSSYDGVVGVEVRKGLAETGPIYYFPITVTKVEGDGRIGCPTDPQTGNPVAYYEYSLSLDCMVVRSAETYDSNGNIETSTDLYNSTRLFGIDPVNISAMISGTYSYGPETNRTVTIIPKTFAARAINDPVYFMSVNSDGTYNYSVTRTTESFAPMDGESNVDDSTGKEITGICVVNTMFGDLRYGDGVGGNGRIYKGTSWSYSDSGVATGGDAIITAYRHLYNIRWINSVTGGTINYRIVRDLNWYYRCSSTKVVSEVRVFRVVNYNSTIAAFESPVDSLGNLRIVSFPALKELKSDQILTSMSRVGGSIYSINNVQMRIASFRDGKDAGYGLICKNSGIIYNIYTNNINIILSDVSDGSYCDYRGNNDHNRLCPSSGVSITSNTGKISDLSSNDNNIVGGLVGYNLGRVGTNDTSVDNDRNVISMNNCIVLAGEYWNGYDYIAGGVIGQNDGTTVNEANVSTFGSIEVRGTFAVVSGGVSQVGGIIGNNKSNISAHLIVDGRQITDSHFTSEFALPVESHYGGQLSCVVAGAGYTGGAIGSSDGRGFNASVNKLDSSMLNSDRVTGAMAFPSFSDRDYQIDVTLPSGSMVLLIGGNDRTVGGAIGRLNNGTGDYISIRVNNSGSIVTTDTATMSKSVSCGGAVGEDTGSAIATVYINVTNGGGSRLGPCGNNDGPIRVGGAFGYISNTVANRSIFINVVNDGKIQARGADDCQGAGGAIAGLTDVNPVDLYINAVNNVNSSINCVGEDTSKANGTGGAIGGMGNVNSDGGTQITENSKIYAKNYGEIVGRYHVGGVIGNAPITNGKIYAENHGSIFGVDYVGGAVGRHNYDHYGTIQSILYSDAKISGTNLVGGAVGRLSKFNDNAELKTIVRGNSTVEGIGSVVGGLCGDLRIVGTGIGGIIELVGDSSDPTLIVKGVNGVGGAVGLLRSELDISASIVTPKQTSTNKLAINISGENHIGGAVGCLHISNNAADDRAFDSIFTDSSLVKAILVDISVVLNPRSCIYGSGDNVGGAVGYIPGLFDSGNYVTFAGRISVTTSAGTTTTDTAIIRGNRYVGGAVGHFYSVVPELDNSKPNGTIEVDFSLAYWRIEATVSDVGGAVGCFDGDISNTIQYGNNNNAYTVTASLGSSTVFSNGGYNVGGVIGRNRVRNGIIKATNIAGIVRGQYNVGGAIGLNEYRFSKAEVTILASGWIDAVGVNPNVIVTSNLADGSKGNGSNVGGVVGCYCYNNPYYRYNSKTTFIAAITSSISAQISGSVTGVGDNVGGAVGFCYSNRRDHLIQSVDATLQGSAVIRGINNVGGAIGFSNSNITNVASNISGSSKVEGTYCVGGAIGWTHANIGKNDDNEDATGVNVLYQRVTIDNFTIPQIETELNRKLYKHSGRIESITATISADYTLRGTACVGGAVGQSGYKSSSGYSSAALINVKAIINSAYLFDPFETGINLDAINPIDIARNAPGNACIGGVIGIVVDGRVNSVVLSGTGGTVNTDDRYPCPEISMNGAVIMAAKGNSIGGIIGQIGLYGYDNPKAGFDYQNVTVSNISSSGTLGICVISMNDVHGVGGNGIGGWIGSGYGIFGGIGNREEKEYNDENKRAVYNVANIRYIYSQGNDVGGFCGRSIGYGGRKTWVDIHVNLVNATITGNTGVGGAFGRIDGVNFLKGLIDVHLSNHTIIGDPLIRAARDAAVCCEAGGAVGNLNLNGQTLGIPIGVVIDSTSHIWSEGGSDNTSNYGVGGVLGRASGKFGVNGTLRVTGSPNNLSSVYSKYSNVGGVVGVMDNVEMKTYTSSSESWSYDISVRADGVDACVGGFVGRINSLTGEIMYCHCIGRDSLVQANGSRACAGGFVGYATWNSDTRRIENCYTTVLVNSSGAYTGGFVGRMLRGKILNCYVGGRTYQGYYVSGEGNVSGVANVGGFIGAATGNSKVTIENCYSTASVLGTADNIGGFAGSTSNNTIVLNSYCTGRVIGPNTATCGAFAGVVGKLANFTNNKAMALINPIGFPLVGTRLTATISDDQIALANDSVIRDGHNDTGHPYDTSGLSSEFALRAVIGTDHYGDWPIPVEDPSIEDVHVMIKIGEDEEGNPIWVDFDDNTFSVEFNGSAVVLDDIIKVDLYQVPLYINQQYVTYYRQNTAVGTATITISAKSGSGYSGAISRTFSILPADIEGADAVLTETSREYSGARIYPERTVTYNGFDLEYLTDYYLEFDRDGDIEEGFDGDNINIGTMYVYIVGKNNYSGVKLIGRFEILPIDLSDLTDDDIDTIGADGLVYDEVDGVPVAYRPGVVVRYNGNTLNGTTDPGALGYDYVVSYEHNDSAGIAYIIITGTAEPSIGTGTVYRGVRRVSFTIAPAVNTWDTEPTMEGWIYGMTPKEPSGAPVYGNLSFGYYRNATCEEEDRINPDEISGLDVGTYYVKVSATESTNYTGPVPVILSFEITPFDITDIAVATAANDEHPEAEYEYTGNVIRPSITVTLPTLTVPLEEGTNYEVAYSTDWINSGTYIVNINGIGNYTGTASCSFTIYRMYTVTFDPNGGSSAPEPRSVREGTPVENPSDPSHESPEIPVYSGHRFDSWCNDTAGASPYDFSLPVTDNLILHAHWVQVYTIEFVTGEGVEPIPSIIVDRGQKVNPDNIPSDPVRDGFDFAGWYTSEAYTDQFDFNTRVIWNNYTLYPRWTPKIFTVTFDTVGGESIIGPQSVEYGQFATRPEDPQWEDHIFEGWYLDGDDEYDFSNPVTTSIVLTAHWTDE